MSINKKIFIVSISFLVTIAIALAIVLFTTEYSKNDITVKDAYLLEATLLEDLKLEGKSFFLSPKFIVENKLDELGYIESYEVKRSLPNHISISVKLDKVIWCNDNVLIFDNDLVKKDKLNEEYCIGKPLVSNLPKIKSDILKYSSDYSGVDEDIKSLVSEIVFIDDITILFKMSDGVTVYMTIIDEKTITKQLNNYFKYNVTNNTIDLRQKYS